MNRGGAHHLNVYLGCERSQGVWMQRSLRLQEPALHEVLNHLVC